MRFWFEVCLYNLHLGGTDRSSKRPAIRRGGCDIERGRTPSGNPELFGDVEETLSFSEHGVFLDIARIHKDGGDIGFNSELFPQGI
jgi:hypothetical protein